MTIDNNPDKRYFELAGKWKNGTITVEEQQEYANWYNHDQEAEVKLSVEFAASAKVHEQRMIEQLNAKIEKTKVLSLPIYRKAIAIAASLALIFSIAGYFYIQGAKFKAKEMVTTGTDIVPGKNTATLTLSTGHTINLSDTKTGVVINASSLKYNDGTAVASLSSGAKEEQQAVTLTAATPRGGTYQVILPDGTKVWLNAASSLRFPSTFTHERQRRVELIGEAYFEVSKDKKHPFIVQSAKQEVEVLGTHFNVNSYPDHAFIKTTLVEGAVRIHVFSGNKDEQNTGAIKVLKPGQQSTVLNNRIVVANIDIEEATSWKDGYFTFSNEPLQNIMEQLSRWYNVEVEYDDETIKTEAFGGRMNKMADISGVFKILEMTGKVTFKIEGRKVIVLKM